MSFKKKLFHPNVTLIFLGNVLWDNGQVSKDAPESRQPYAGLTLNTALDVEVRDNFVETEFKDDYAYVITPNSKLNAASGNNKVLILIHLKKDFSEEL